MSSTNKDEPRSPSSGNSIWQNKRVRRLILYAAVLLVVFLAGLVPMWWTSRRCARERDAAQASLQISHLQNTPANAAIDARRGEYERARQAASDFFTNLGAEVVALGRDSVFNEGQRTAVRSVFDTRDDTITLLALIEWDQHHLAMRTNGACECAPNWATTFSPAGRKDRREIC